MTPFPLLSMDPHGLNPILSPTSSNSSSQSDTSPAPSPQLARTYPAAVALAALEADIAVVHDADLAAIAVHTAAHTTVGYALETSAATAALAAVRAADSVPAAAHEVPMPTLLLPLLQKSRSQNSTQQKCPNPINKTRSFVSAPMAISPHQATIVVHELFETGTSWP